MVYGGTATLPQHGQEASLGHRREPGLKNQTNQNKSANVFHSYIIMKGELFADIKKYVLEK